MGLFIVVVGIVVFVVVAFPNLRQKANSGFGPDWDCTSVGKGDPICVKRPPIDPIKETK